MGSELARDKHDSTLPNTVPNYYPSWLHANLALGEPRNLQLQEDGSDWGHQFVIPNGYVDFCVRPLFCLEPYSNFKTWCDHHNIQLLVFGFDWRRSAKDAADLFLKSFLPAVDKALSQVEQKLVNYAFVGHSSGGMAVKLAINNTNDLYVQGMKCAITVGTPFYGYGGQTRRFLFGEKALNWSLADPGNQNREMARIMATMPGGYEFLFMSKDVYLCNERAFCNDTDYPLEAYPSVAVDYKGDADPYNPQDTKDAAFYPLFNKHNLQMLAAGRDVAKEVAQPVDGAVAAKFYNIRGVQMSGRVPRNNTIVSTQWKRLPLNYNPDASPPIDPLTDTMGCGDSVQPAWGARLLQLMDKPYCNDRIPHVITVAGDVDHVDLMNEDVVLEKLALILGIRAVQPVVPWVRPAMATVDDFDAFLAGMPRSASYKAKSPVDRRLDLLRYLLSIEALRLLKLARRGFSDLLKGGPLRVAQAKPKPKPKTTTRAKLKRKAKKR
jgi:hypothetical protein